MPGRFVVTVLAVFGFPLICASSGTAFEVTFDGEVLRYRGQQAERFQVEVQRRPSHLLIEATRYRFEDPMPSVGLGPGCHRETSEWWKVVVQCPLPSGRSQPRYRFTPADVRVSFTLADTKPQFTLGDFRGVVYAGRGHDNVIGADRVYGGAGWDSLVGTRVYGGPGNDSIEANSGAPDTPILHGGPGNDVVSAPGLVYGGPGADVLGDTPFSGEESADMLVGGPGQDKVWLASDGRRDVIRVRGGGVDRLRCPLHPDPRDALFVDRSDRLDTSCTKATVLYTERPRYPYP